MITVDESMFHHLAAKCGVLFNGMQKDGKGGRMPMFTHDEFRTFVLSPDESLQQAIERKRKQFTKRKENK